MRWAKLLLPLGGALAVCYFLISYLIDARLTRGQDELTAGIRLATGLDVTVTNKLRITAVLPAIRLQADGIKLSEKNGEPVAGIESVSARITFVDGLVGLVNDRLHLAELIVATPRVAQKASDKALFDSELKGTQAASGTSRGKSIWIDRLAIRDGQIEFRLPGSDLAIVTQDVGIAGSVRTDSPYFEGSGKALVNGVSVTLDSLAIAQVEKGIGTKLQVGIGQSKLDIRGAYVSKQFSGDLTADIPAIGPAASEMARLLRMDEPDLPVPGKLAVHVDGAVVATPSGLDFKAATLKLGEDTGRGSVELKLGAARSLLANLELASLDARQWTFARKTPATQAPSCKQTVEPAKPLGDRALNLDIKASIAIAKYASAKISDVQLDFRSHEGLVTIPKFMATLPGGAIMNLNTGSVASTSGALSKGTVTLKAPMLRETLRAFDIELSQFKDNALTSFDFAGDLEWSRDHASLTSLAFSLDDTSGQGSIRLDRGVTMSISSALTLRSASVGRYVAKGQFEDLSIRGTGIRISADLAAPDESMDCLKLVGAKVHVDRVDAAGRRPASGASPTSASDAVSTAATDLANRLDALPLYISDLLDANKSDNPIETLLLARIEAALPHLGPILKRIDSPNPIILTVGKLIAREDDHAVAVPSAPFTFSDLALGVSVRPVTTPDPPVERHRASLDISVSDISTPTLHLTQAQSEATMDYSIDNQAVQIIALSLDNLRIAGDVQDPVRTEGMPRIIGAGEPVRRLPFAINATLQVTGRDISGTLHSLEVGDLIVAEKIAISLARERNQPITLRMHTADSRLVTGTNQQWSRAGVNLSTLAPAEAPCRAPAALRDPALRTDILLRGKPTRLSGAYALLDGSGATEPSLQAISIQGGIGKKSFALDDLSAHFGSKSTLSLRLSVEPGIGANADDYLVGGCLSVAAAVRDLPQVSGDALRKLMQRNARALEPTDAAKFELVGRFLLDDDKVSSIDALSAKIEVQPGSGLGVETVAAKASMIHVQLPPRSEPGGRFALRLGGVQISTERNRISLAPPRQEPLIEITKSARGDMPCGKGARTDVVMNVGELSPDTAEAIYHVKAWWDDFSKGNAEPPKANEARGGTECAPWTAKARIGHIGAVADSVSMLLHGKAADGNSPDKGRLENIAIELEGKTSDRVTYKIAADLVAQPPSLPSTCNPVKEIDVAPRRSIDISVADRRFSLEGELPAGGAGVWSRRHSGSMRCIDLRHLWILYEASMKPAATVAKIKKGMIEVLAFHKEEGDLDKSTGSLDFDANVSADLLLSSIPQAFAKLFVGEFLEKLGDNFPISARIDAKVGALEGKLESVDSVAGNRGHRNYDFARKFPHILKVSMLPGTKIAGPLDLNVEFRSPTRWRPAEHPKCSRDSAQIPGYHNIADICIWACERSAQWWPRMKPTSSCGN